MTTHTAITAVRHALGSSVSPSVDETYAAWERVAVEGGWPRGELASWVWSAMETLTWPGDAAEFRDEIARCSLEQASYTDAIRRAVQSRIGLPQSGAITADAV